MSRSHIAVAEKCCHMLANDFPNAGIGICGSVAKNCTRPDSDVDLVIINKGTGNATHGRTRFQGFLINVQVLHLDSLRSDNLGLAASFMPFFLSYLRHALPVVDPNEYLAEGIAWAHTVYSERHTNPETLVRFLHTFAKRRYQLLQHNISGLEQEILSYNLQEAAIQAFLAMLNVTAESTRDASQLFCDAVEKHPRLQALLSDRQKSQNAFRNPAWDALEEINELSLNMSIT